MPRVKQSVACRSASSSMSMYMTPAELAYKTGPCRQGNRCPAPQSGLSTCPFYHSDSDFRRHPARWAYGPTMCRNVGNCPGGDHCAFAHNNYERLYHPAVFQTEVCRQYERTGHCQHGKYCAHIHEDPQPQVHEPWEPHSGEPLNIRPPKTQALLAEINELDDQVQTALDLAAERYYHLEDAKKAYRENNKKMQEELQAERATHQATRDSLGSLSRQLAETQEKQRVAEARLALVLGEKVSDLSLSELKILRDQLRVAMDKVEAARECKILQQVEGKRAASEADCCVCFEAAPNTCLTPCGHLLCGKCADQVRVCPLCRVVVAARTKIHR